MHILSPGWRSRLLRLCLAFWLFGLASIDLAQAQYSSSIGLPPPAVVADGAAPGVAAVPPPEVVPAPASVPTAAPLPPSPRLDSANTAWMLTASILVLLMTLPGVALFYAGMVRKKNVLSTMTQVFACAAVVTLTWMALGYSLALRPGSPYLGGMDRLLLHGLALDGLAGIPGAAIPESVYFMFQLTFAVITTALVVGGFAERMKFSAVLLFAALWSLAVYAPVAHWVWESDGWLARLGVLDYAGGTVVHINAGVAGLVAAVLVGRRLGYGSEPMMPHNLAFSIVGAALLWVGWFGFNAGSALAADARAGMAMLVTQVASAAAACAWLIVEWAFRGRPSALGVISGAVAGLVAITPASGYVDASGALLIGVAGGVACYLGATGLKRLFGYDDSLDVFGIHAVGGVVGALLTGLFASPAIGGVRGNVFKQFLGLGATVAFSAVATTAVLVVVSLLVGLRASEDEEREGLDISQHGEQLE
ncbi:MAG TPA: ammonium transporter [Azospira sp.]|nr:ammonium transporter [Azospira sp.]